MSEADEYDFPFEAEYRERQAEKMPEFGIDWNQRSPLAIGNLPERNFDHFVDINEMVKTAPCRYRL